MICFFFHGTNFKMTIVLNWDQLCQKFAKKIQSYENRFETTAHALLRQIDAELLKNDDDLLVPSADNKRWFLDIEDETFLRQHVAFICRWLTRLNEYLKIQTHGKLQIEDADDDAVTIAYHFSK